MKRLRKQFILAIILMTAIAFLLLSTSADAQTISSSARQQTSSVFAKENPSQALQPLCSAYVITYATGANSRRITFTIIWGCAGSISPHSVYIDYGDGNYDDYYCGPNCDSGSITFTHTYPYHGQFLVNTHLNNEFEPFYDYTIASNARYVIA